MGNFRERLKAARLSAGLSQEQLGIKAGIQEADSARTRINRYETGARVPDPEVAAHIARALNVPVSYLYSQDDDEANLLLAFHRMSDRERINLLDAVEKKSF